MWSAKSGAGHREQLSQRFSLNLTGNVKESKGRGGIGQRKTKRVCFKGTKDVRKAIDNKEVHEGKIRLALTKDQKENLKKKGNFNHSKKAEHLWRNSSQSQTSQAE